MFCTEGKPADLVRCNCAIENSYIVTAGISEWFDTHPTWDVCLVHPNFKKLGKKSAVLLTLAHASSETYHLSHHRKECLWSRQKSSVSGGRRQNPGCSAVTAGCLISGDFFFTCIINWGESPLLMSIRYLSALNVFIYFVIAGGQ